MQFVVPTVALYPCFQSYRCISLLFICALSCMRFSLQFYCTPKLSRLTGVQGVFSRAKPVRKLPELPKRNSTAFDNLSHMGYITNAIIPTDLLGIIWAQCNAPSTR